MTLTPLDNLTLTAAYDRTLDDPFALQNEISAAIVEALRPRLAVELSTTERNATPIDADAHSAYLRGLYLAAGGTQASLEQAIDALGEAVSLAPDFAPAHSDLGNTLLMAEAERYSWDELMAEASRQATIALSLAPDSPQAHAAQGRLLWNPGKTAGVLPYYRRALELNPSYADAWAWLAHQDHLIGTDEALAAAKKAARLAPLSPNVYFYVYQLLLRNRLA